MTTQNENSPLTQTESGQKNRTEPEARELFPADNGTAANNLSEERCPAPKQASEATAQRPSTENPTAECIFGANTAAGNETNPKVRTVPMLQKIPVARDQDGYFIHPDLRYFWTVTMDGAEHCSKEQWTALEAQAGIKTSIYYLESEPEDHPAVLAYWERGEGISLWNPEPEPGWWLIEIGDSEDGPYAVTATFA
ncbi:hypothetical protein [Burkholderia sp. BCC1640]|uniref:hypothetical protein n=1 Tax=Burkholderia sp. BCC1640 TaxID=2676294 RepID=UPI001FC86EF3|nr:hypothetical protein [Burkholderia sp. BCC1640]